MMYFINTRDPDYKAINQYLLNLGVLRPRRNARQSIQRDPFAHKLMNMMLRQAAALGWGAKIDLRETNITPGSPHHWGRLPKPFRILNLDEIIELIKMQVRLLGIAAPIANCYLKGGGELEVPMIVDWVDDEKDRRGKLHWKPPLLRLEDRPTEDSTHIVFDYEGNQVEVETIMKGEQTVAGGRKIKRPVPKCYDNDGRHFRLFRPSDVSRWYTVYPLPFIPAEWARSTGKRELIRIFGTGVLANIDDPGFEIIEGGAAVISPEATWDIIPRINSDYDTPTAQKVKELALDYPDEVPVKMENEDAEAYEARLAKWNKNKDNKYQWQELALTRFVDSGFSGMVEACTGSGKTIFCANAIKAVMRSEMDLFGDEKPDLCISIVVPTIALLRQWYDFLKNDDYGLKRELQSGLLDGVSRHGGGSSHRLTQVNLFVVNTAANMLPIIRSDEDIVTLHAKQEEAVSEAESTFSTDSSKKPAPEIVEFGVTLKAGDGRSPGEAAPGDKLPEHITPANIKEFNEKYRAHFLIVDEAHRTTADTFSYIYNAPRDYTLLVSATFPTDRDKYEILDDQTTGKMLCFYRYPHALKKGNISDFNLHFLRFRLSAEEVEINDQTTALIRHFSTQHSSEIGSSEAESLEAVQSIDKGSDPWKILERDRSLQRELGVKIFGGKARAIRKDSYSIFMMKVLGGARARLSWSSGNRLACALSLISLKLKEDKTIIVFHKSVDGAAALYKLLYNQGWGAGGPLGGEYGQIGIYHSQLPPSVNAAYLKAFKEKKIRCLISVQALLEGLDVPHCDVGIAVAADQSDIKLVQALGRVLRISPGTPKKDYYFLSGILGYEDEEGTQVIRGTKDLVVEAKFENTLKDTTGKWIIDPPTTADCASISPDEVIALKEEAGLPTAVTMEGFVKELMENNDKDDKDANWDIDEDSPTVEDDIKTGEDEFKQRVEITHPWWVLGESPPSSPITKTRSGFIRIDEDSPLDIEEVEEAQEALRKIEEELESDDD